MENAGNQTAPTKVTLANILGVEGKDTYNPPYDKASFERYLIEEHTSENIEFWNAAQKYKLYASRYYPSLISRSFHNSFAQLKQALSKGKLTGNDNRETDGTRNTAAEIQSPKTAMSPTSEGGLTGATGAIAGSTENAQEGSSKGIKVLASESAENAAGDDEELTDEVRKKLKEALGEIIKLYLTPGSEKEINVNDNVRKKVTTRYEQGDYAPEVLRPAVDKAFEMMKVQSLARYLAHCQKSGAVPSKATLSPTETNAGERQGGDKKDKCVLM